MTSSSYSDVHRMFLQSMMSRCIVSKTIAVELLRKCLQLSGHSNIVRDNDLIDIISEINNKISNFGQELKIIKAEKDAEEFLVLINLTDDSTIYTKINHPYTVKERELFRLLLEAIVLAGTYGSVSTMDALNLNVPNMRAGEIQDTINKLLVDEWFLETNSGLLVPAPRCIAEFDLYLKRNFHEHVSVCLCENVVFYGVQCPHCDAIFHMHCFTQVNKGKKGMKCPTCHNLITREELQNGVTNGNTEANNDETPDSQNRRTSRRISTPETPANTPAQFRHVTPDSSQDMDTTPVPTRGRRKRQSAD